MCRSATLGWQSRLRRTGHSRSRHQIGDGRLRIHHRHVHLAERRTDAVRTDQVDVDLGADAAEVAQDRHREMHRETSAASARATSAARWCPSLRMSSSAYSRRSKDLVTAGSRCWPALVNTSECGRRSKSCTPISRSSAMTCRDSALWEISSAFAAAVKLSAWRRPRRRAAHSEATSVDPWKTWTQPASP